MVIFKFSKIILDWCFPAQTVDIQEVPPLKYRGFAKDRRSLANDCHKVAGDIQRGWQKTKRQYL